ncbi:MAG: glucose 1-dehydrogenase [Rhodospirillales bacterium]|nr:glucose 1-dehydrogenase [Rhodospirillales bacterium]
MNDNGKTALVTGATSGIGAAIALELAAQGHAVMLAGRDAARAAAMEERVRAAGGRASSWLGDLSAPGPCQALVEASVERFGGIDVLVNNAGIIHYGTAEETTEAVWDETLAVNVSAVFYMSRAAVPALRPRGGVIVNIASDWGLAGGRRAVAYCVSKGAVVQLTRAMALDHAHENIRVNAICPGDTDTPMLDVEARERGQDPAEARREMAAEVPLGRIATPEEIAKLAAFLVSDGAAYMTGAAIAIDGGNTAA